MKFWQYTPGSVPKFHFGTPLNCQPENEGCHNMNALKKWRYRNQETA
ncbi:MAG: hypothetical protein GY795_23410 [Desulfobacterales bacterium]|nr:hypothetical protein [Desulfobacterales bacterium]